jgi:hypothetical protein
MSSKELANQFRESMIFEYQLSDLDVIRMFSNGIKGITLEQCIDSSDNRNGFLKIIEVVSDKPEMTR